MKLALSIAGGCIVLIMVIGGYRFYRTAQELAIAQQQLTETENQVTDLQNKLTHSEAEKAVLAQSLTDEQKKVGGLAAQINAITGMVGTLQKLSATDPELLKKYSKVYFLNENYIPAGLTSIDKKYLYPPEKPQQMHTAILPFLESLLAAAQTAGMDLKILSAYRSFDTQASVKSAYTVIYGAGTANQFSADQGYSEHQLGTAVDFTTTKTGTSLGDFEKTQAFPWLMDQAHKFGFILSYPKGNAFYIYEPWHWRFVGVRLATKLHDEGRAFYDIDQREINPYLVSIFDPM